MKRRYLNALLAAAVGVSTGCASPEKTSFWANPMAGFRPGTADTDAQPSAMASLRGKFARDNESELSPEFQAARKTLKKHPEKTLLAWARYQEDIGEYAEARKMYREMQIAYPNNIEAHLGMARIEMLTGRSRQSQDILAKLATDWPDNADVRLAIGRMYVQQEKWPEAIGAFEEACEISPEDQNCRYELGVAFAQSGNFDQALSNLTYSVGEPAAHYNIGYILHDQGRDADATEWFRNALQLHPDQQTAMKSRAMLTKLNPVEPSAPSTQMVAQQNFSGRGTPAIAKRNLGRPQNSAAPTDGSQTSGVLPGEFSGADLPVVSSGRQHRTVGTVSSTYSDSVPSSGPVATMSSAQAPQYLPHTDTQATPFRTASYTDPQQNTTAVSDNTVGQQPRQWHGPTTPTVPPATSPVVVEQTVVKDPTNWRARRD